MQYPVSQRTGLARLAKAGRARESSELWLTNRQPSSAAKYAMPLKAASAATK
jgi:hypothetical protein